MEDEYYLLLEGLSVADLRRVLSKYSVPVGSGQKKKAELQELYKTYDVPSRIRQRQEEDLARRQLPRKRTIEMISAPPRRASPKKRRTSLRRSHSLPEEEKPDAMEDDFIPSSQPYVHLVMMNCV